MSDSDCQHLEIGVLCLETLPPSTFRPLQLEEQLMTFNKYSCHKYLGREHQEPVDRNYE